MTKKTKRKRIIKRNAECENCGFRTKLRQYSEGYDSKGPINPSFQCELCANTHECFDREMKTLQSTLLYCTNAILKAIEEKVPVLMAVKEPLPWRDSRRRPAPCLSYCEPCGSWHDRPQDKGHHEALRCRAPWEEKP